MSQFLTFLNIILTIVKLLPTLYAWIKQIYDSIDKLPNVEEKFVEIQLLNQVVRTAALKKDLQPFLKLRELYCERRRILS